MKQRDVKKYQTASQQETEQLAANFVHALKAGGVVALIGNLGAGKTAFVKGIAAALGVTEMIQSPTFVLMKTYPVKHTGITTLVHVDCYRVEKADDLLAVGLGDYLHDPAALIVMEWADRVSELIPATAWVISLQRQGGETKRKISVQHPAPARQC